jgi:hypothetical protein
VIDAAELDRLRARHHALLKDEPESTVEVLGDGEAAVVRKTYRNRGLRWWQSLWRQSRARREHDRLAAIAAANVPCVAPLGWSEDRRAGGVGSSTLLTRWVPHSTPLKHVLRALPPSAATAPVRARLATAMGALVAALHRAGFLWCTPMPRNALVAGEPADARLVVCDPPSCLDLARDLHAGRFARIDLFLGAFSASRRREWSRVERLRWLLGYTAGDRTAARRLWRALARRSALRNAVERALAMGLFLYILDGSRARRRARATAPR